MEQIISLLFDADKELNTVSVSGDDVFRMRNARTLMKTAFDLLQELAKNDQKCQEEPDDAG